MKLTKRHVGRLFDVAGSDGSWCYLLIAINKESLLFYSFNGKYYIEDRKKYHDWRPFKGVKFPKQWIEQGWITGTKIT